MRTIPLEGFEKHSVAFQRQSPNMHQSKPTTGQDSHSVIISPAAQINILQRERDNRERDKIFTTHYLHCSVQKNY